MRALRSARCRSRRHASPPGFFAAAKLNMLPQSGVTQPHLPPRRILRTKVFAIRREFCSAAVPDSTQFSGKSECGTMQYVHPSAPKMENQHSPRNTQAASSTSPPASTCFSGASTPASIRFSGASASGTSIPSPRAATHKSLNWTPPALAPKIEDSRGGSSVGRALRSQCRGRGFNSLPLHLAFLVSLIGSAPPAFGSPRQALPAAVNGRDGSPL